MGHPPSSHTDHHHLGGPAVSFDDSDGGRIITIHRPWSCVPDLVLPSE